MKTLKEANREDISELIYFVRVLYLLQVIDGVLFNQIDSWLVLMRLTRKNIKRDASSDE